MQKSENLENIGTGIHPKENNILKERGFVDIKKTAKTIAVDWCIPGGVIARATPDWSVFLNILKKQQNLFFLSAYFF